MSEGLGEWDPRVLPNRLKGLIDEIIYSVAVQDNSKAIRAITDMFSDVRNPKLICIDSGIKKVEKKKRKRTPIVLRSLCVLLSFFVILILLLLVSSK